MGQGLGMGLRHGLEDGLGLRHGLEAWGREGCLGLRHGGEGWLGLSHGREGWPRINNGKREVVSKTWKLISRTSKTSLISEQSEEMRGIFDLFEICFQCLIEYLFSPLLSPCHPSPPCLMPRHRSFPHASSPCLKPSPSSSPCLKPMPSPCLKPMPQAHLFPLVRPYSNRISG